MRLCINFLRLKPRECPPRHAFSGRKNASGRLGASTVCYEFGDHWLAGDDGRGVGKERIAGALRDASRYVSAI
jgi:hypothetical protein